MSKIVKKIEKELMIISYKGDFHKEDVINEYNKEMEKRKEEGWSANIVKINYCEDDLIELVIILEKGNDAVLYKEV